MNKITPLLLSLSIALASCTAQKTLEATGGSRADGTIDLSYELGQFEQPVVDTVRAGQTAKARCAAWGYRVAEPFGGGRKQCEMPGGFGGCGMWLITVKYQCLGYLK